LQKLNALGEEAWQLGRVVAADASVPGKVRYIE